MSHLICLKLVFGQFESKGLAALSRDGLGVDINLVVMLGEFTRGSIDEPPK